MNYKLSILFTAIFFFTSGCRDAGVNPVPSGQLSIKGYSYTSFHTDGFSQGGVAQALDDCRSQTASEWIALCPFEFQSSPTSTDIGPNSNYINPVTGSGWYATSSEADIREGVRQARVNGMKIMLKPHLDLYTGEWRAAIVPDAGGAWFTAYTTMMMKYAQLAQELNIEMLCIGVELIKSTQSAYTNNWLLLIANLRKVYSGKLTYSANWSGAYGISQPEFEQVQFWQSLDYIGIDAYFPLTNSLADPVPDFDSAVKRMQDPLNKISALSTRYGKMVILTELGCQSAKGALSSPGDYSIGSGVNAVQDNSAQALYYRVMTESLGQQSYCAGMFWWNWESVRSQNEATNFTCRNKTAAVVLQQFYRSKNL